MPQISRPIPTNKRPNNCITTELRGSIKTCHYIQAPATSATITCLCGKYHTNFYSNKNLTYDQHQSTNIIKKPKDKRLLATNTVDSTDFIPPSPTSSPSPSLHQHTCPKCNQPINCKVTNNKHYLAADAELFNDEPCHKSCLDTQSEPETQPTTNPEQEPSHVLSLQEIEQSLNTYRNNNPLISELNPLTPTTEDTTNDTTTNTTDMDIDSSTLPDTKQQHQQQTQQQTQQQQQQVLEQTKQ